MHSDCNPTYGQLKALLRDGWEPENIPGSRSVGSGFWRTAYRIGAFVVKESMDGLDPCEEEPREEIEAAKARLRSVGLRPAPTVKVGVWEIQPYYEKRFGEHNSPLTRKHFVLDVHHGNVALDNRNRLVAFDW